MARQKQIDVLRQGAEKWNVWRQKYPQIKIDLGEADLSGADLSGAKLQGADLQGADLSGANLRGASFYGIIRKIESSGERWFIPTNLSGADLTRARLWDAKLRNADLRDADFSGAKLQGADLQGADLSGAKLRNADLSGANLQKADLSETDLSGANLVGANLVGANLRGANLVGANLRRADLSGANLVGANLSNIITDQTHFDNIDLRDVKGLETIRHEGPSHISTSTLEKSNGQIPEIFLQGAGVGDSLIEYTYSLFKKPIEYYTCFISYSSNDDLFARRLHNDLQQKGVRCWFAPEDMDIGDKIKHRIDESIRLYDKLLLVLSEHSIASTWVEYEVERALNKEPQGIPNVLYPVRVDQAVMTCSAPWAKDIKSTRHIGNFENWTNPQHYEENFQLLLRALNTKKDQQKK